MSRNRAIMWGALYGGIIGPALGGVLFALTTILLPGRPSKSEFLSALGYMPLMGVLWFGLPGLLVGAFGAVAIRRLPSSTNRVFNYLAVSLFGLLPGIIAVGFFNALITRSSPLDLIYFYAAAGFAGAVTSGLFLKQLRQAAAKASS